jgi:hypothetical protein
MPQDTQTNFAGVIVRLRNPNESGMFPGIVAEALGKINSKPVGKKLLAGIAGLSSRAKFGYTVCIMRPSGLGIEDKNDGKGPQWNSGSVAKRGNETDACNGTGTVTQVIWNANIVETPDGSRPAFIALAHELVHAYYNLKGEAYSDTSTEEYATVGLAPLKDLREVNENLIRAEHGVALRAQYGGLTAPTVVPKQ